MAAELGPILYTTGSTVRAMLFNESGQVRDTTNWTWDTWADGDIDDYDIAMTELGTSGVYYANAPTLVTIDGAEYDMLVYVGAVSLANIRLAIGLQKVGARTSNLVAVNGEEPSMAATVDANITKLLGTAWLAPATAGTPDVALIANAVDSTSLAASAATEIASAVSAGSNPTVLQTTTIATLASQTSFTLTAGSADDNAYNNCIAIITDASTSTQKAVGVISDYVGSTKTITLKFNPGIFTMATGDAISIVTPIAETSGPVEHTHVPSGRILTVKSRSDGTFGVVGRVRLSVNNGAGETLWWAVDLRGTQLAAGDLVDAVSAPTITGAEAANLTTPAYGVFGTLVKFKCVLSGSAATTDTINVKLTITPDGSESLIVIVPVTVLS